MIVARDINKNYNDKKIIKNFNYKFEKGIYLIVGNSGCGKTTLLNILAKEDKLFSGKVICDSDILYIKDKNNLIGDLKVKEHYLLYEKINDLEINEYFCLKHLSNKRVKKLSLGERQLVNLNIVLSCKEKVIILDEPFSALHIENIKRACLLFEKMLKDKIVIISTHNKEYFNDYKEIDLNSKKMKYPITKDVDIVENNEKRCYSGCLKLFYVRKIIFKKIFFVISLMFIIFNYFYLNQYLNNSFSSYLSYFKENRGIVVNKENEIQEIDEDKFYEIVKMLEEYVIDYNANYYNSNLYDKDFMIDDYYIDNAFILSSIKYIDKSLKEDEVVLGVNYRDFCLNNVIFNCDKNYIKTLIINKEVQHFNFKIKDTFDSEENVVLSNKRFYKFYEDNEYEEFYFDILKENKNKMFATINNNEYLSNFKFILIGENESHLRYKVEVGKFFNKPFEYENYLVCLNKGYNCLNYLKHFETLVAIDQFKKIENLDLKLIDKDLKLDEIVVSSKLSNVLNKKEGEFIEFLFNYDERYISIDLKIVEIIEDDSLRLFQNNDWSYNFFDELVGLSQEDLRVESIVIYDNLKNGYYKSDDIYNEIVNELRKIIDDMKKLISYINISMSVISLVILIVIEVYQNRFRKEYYRFLKMLNVNL